MIAVMNKAIQTSPQSPVRGEVMEGRPPSFTDPVKFAEDIDKYFEQCGISRDIPTITGLAVFLDTDRKTLYNYRSKDQFFPAIKRALARCEAAIETRAMLGGINATMAIFSLKNNYGWVDQTQVDNTVHLPTPILGAVNVQSDDGDTQNLIP